MHPLVWLVLHPVLASYVVLIGWPVVTGGINLAFREAETYALTHPKFAAAKKLLQKWGLSPKGTIALVQKLWTKATNLPPPDDSGDFGVLSTGLQPPDAAPMRPSLTPRMRACLAASLIILFAGPVIALLSGCGGAPTHAEVEKGAYAADDGVCVAEATDHDGGTQCLDKYQRLYGVFWPDSGLTVCEINPVDAGSDGAK